MNFLSWILVGGIAGWLGGKIMGSDKMGFLTNILIGIVGAFVGGLFVGLLGGGGVTGFNIWSLLVATLGSVVLIWIVRKIKK